MASSFESCSQEFKDKKGNHLPYRIILRKKDDVWQGLVEHSFCMGFASDRVLIFWSGTAYSNFGTTHEMDAQEWAEGNFKPDEGDLMFDPFSEECPVQVDWEDWMKADSKFTQRNAKFKVIEQPYVSPMAEWKDADIYS